MKNKIDLKKYKKENSENDTVISSIALNQDHKKFLESEKINLSLLVRDVLDSLIKNKKEVL